MSSTRFHHARKVLPLVNSQLYHTAFKGSFQISFWLYLFNGTSLPAKPADTDSCFSYLNDTLNYNQSAPFIVKEDGEELIILERTNNLAFSTYTVKDIMKIAAVKRKRQDDNSTYYTLKLCTPDCVHFTYPLPQNAWNHLVQLSQRALFRSLPGPRGIAHPARPRGVILAGRIFLSRGAVCARSGQRRWPWRWLLSIGGAVWLRRRRVGGKAAARC